MSDNIMNTLEKRTQELTTNVFNQEEKLNMDTLFDSIQSLYFEVKNSKLKAPGYESFCKRFEKEVKNISSLRVNMEDFERLKLLGQGGFGKVVLVRQRYTKKVYAMKIMNKSLLLRSNQSAFFWEEREIMALSNCSWLVKLHYAFIDTENIYMLMDFIQGGDLINLMSCYDIPLEWTQFYVAEAALAIHALHELGFIHLDVKPDNMLLDHNGHLKLCDFGTCVNVSETGSFKCNFAVGTPDYISPEMLSSQNHEIKITKATDWWSWGILFYELLFEEPAFSSDSLVGTYAKISNFESSLKFPDQSGPLKPACALISRVFVNVYVLIDMVLNYIEFRDERIGFEEIKNDPFFKTAPWNFDNVQNFAAPFIPEIKSDDDISNFDISDSNETSNVPKRSHFAGVAGDQFNFIGFSFNPSLHEAQLNMGNPKSIENIMMDERKDDKLQIELNGVKDNLDILQHSLFEIEKNNNNLLLRNNELDVKLKDLSFQLENEKQMNKELQDKMEEQLRKEKVNEEKIKEYMEKITQHNTQIDHLQSMCHILENEKTKIELTNSNNEFDSMTLKKSYGSVEKQMNTLKLKYQQMEKELDRLSAELLLEKQQNIQLSKLRDDSEESSRTSLTTELNVAAVKNRAMLIQNDEEFSKKLRNEHNYLKIEINNLKDIIRQNTENELNIKNDIRIVSNENKQLKENLNNTLQDVKNNTEFVELERKYKSNESYVNLYKKQVKELTTRVESLITEASALRTEMGLEIQKKKEFQNNADLYKKSYVHEILIVKQLKHKIELIETNNKFEISKLKSEQENTAKQLETTKTYLENAENQVIVINARLEESAMEYNILLKEKNNESKKIDENLMESSKWKNLCSLEKLKKDQTIKKLDEMVQMMATKGMIASHTTNISESKMIKKLQMELRSEKIKYEKLFSERQNIILEHSQKTQKLENKIQLLKDERHQLQALANSNKNRDLNNNTSFSMGSNQNTLVRLSYPSNSLTNDMEYTFDEDPKPMKEKLVKNIITHTSSLSLNSNIHIEGIISLIPFSKAKRATRKIVWKKYYGVLTLNELLIFSEKNEKNTPSKAFKKVETRCIKSVSKASHSDLTKSDSKDIPKVLMVRYFDQDIANIAGVVKKMNHFDDNILNFDPSDTSIKKFKGHSLVISKVDDQPFCGACSSNLNENNRGGQLIYCYECKKCALKFHSFHINTNDSAVSCCSHDNSKNDDFSDFENSNFYMNMFLMTTSVDEQSRWIYAFNRVIKMSRTMFHNKRSSTSDNEFTSTPISENLQSKLKKKVTIRYLESVLSRSRTNISKNANSYNP